MVSGSCQRREAKVGHDESGWVGGFAPNFWGIPSRSD